MERRRDQESRAALWRAQVWGEKTGEVLSPFRYDLTKIDSSVDMSSATTCIETVQRVDRCLQVSACTFSSLEYLNSQVYYGKLHVLTPSTNTA